MKTNTIIKEHGKLDIFYRTSTNDIPVTKCLNIAVNTGKDVVANALAGNSGISYLYLAYINGSADITYLPIAPTTTISAFTGLSSPYGCIKVPVHLIGGIGDGRFTLQGITSSGTPINENTMSDFEIDSKIFSIGLVGVVNGIDTLFSIANIKDTEGANSYISKIANAQVGVNWTVSLTMGE